MVARSHIFCPYFEHKRRVFVRHWFCNHWCAAIADQGMNEGCAKNAPAAIMTLYASNIRLCFVTKFSFPYKRRTWLLIVLFVFINGIVLYNAWFHNPRTGYDADAHIMYMGILSEGQLPTRAQTYEYFSPPLPYVIPAAAFHYLSRTQPFGAELAVKVGQLSQWLLSVGTILLLLRFCERLHPKDLNFKLAALAFLGVLPVYYKTFAFMRGEPFVVFLGLLSAYEFLAFMQEYPQRPRLYWRALRIGLWLGLAVMSRQWAIFIMTAVALFILREIWRYATTNELAPGSPRSAWRRRVHLPFLGAGLVMTILIMVVGGWFFVHLYITTGHFTAFNETPQAQFSLSNQPSSFYKDLALDKLFTDPVRPMFQNKFWPQFYAEIWGDYFAYFLVYGWHVGDGRYVFDGRVLEEALAQHGGAPEGLETNRYTISRYLGWVNLAALPVSLFMLVAFVWNGRYVYQWLTTPRPSFASHAYAFFWLVILITWIGYGIFLIMFPYVQGATVKATYVLHIFPLLALLCAEFLEQIRARSPRSYSVLIGVLGIFFLFVLPACFTRYPISPLGFFQPF